MPDWSTKELAAYVDRLVVSLGKLVAFLTAPDTWSWDKWRPFITTDFLCVMFPFVFMLFVGLIAIFSKRRT
jgi:hypothetical protein